MSTDYLNDPRTGKLAYGKLKKYLIEKGLDKSEVGDAGSKFALVMLAEAKQVSIQVLLDEVGPLSAFQPAPSARSSARSSNRGTGSRVSAAKAAIEPAATAAEGNGGGALAVGGSARATATALTTPTTSATDAPAPAPAPQTPGDGALARRGPASMPASEAEAAEVGSGVPASGEVIIPDRDEKSVQARIVAARSVAARASLYQSSKGEKKEESLAERAKRRLSVAATGQDSDGKRQADAVTPKVAPGKRLVPSPYLQARPSDDARQRSDSPERASVLVAKASDGVEHRINRHELATGIDLDGDGDVGLPGAPYSSSVGKAAVGGAKAAVGGAKAPPSEGSRTSGARPPPQEPSDSADASPGLGSAKLAVGSKAASFTRQRMVSFASKIETVVHAVVPLTTGNAPPEQEGGAEERARERWQRAEREITEGFGKREERRPKDLVVGAAEAFAQARELAKKAEVQKEQERSRAGSERKSIGAAAAKKKAAASFSLPGGSYTLEASTDGAPRVGPAAANGGMGGASGGGAGSSDKRTTLGEGKAAFAAAGGQVEKPAAEKLPPPPREAGAAPMAVAAAAPAAVKGGVDVRPSWKETRSTPLAAREARAKI
jgi:hypothetical protein